jgi:excisionase family DNA binding protein
MSVKPRMRPCSAAPTREEIAAGDFITVKRAKERLGVTDTHVYALMDRGELAYGRWGRARRVSVVSLEHYIRKNLVARPSSGPPRDSVT